MYLHQRKATEAEHERSSLIVKLLKKALGLLSLSRDEKVYEVLGYMNKRDLIIERDEHCGLF